MGQGALQVSDEANLAAGQQAWKLHTQATSRGVAHHSMEPDCTLCFDSLANVTIGLLNEWGNWIN
jgi:hypothetical protein